MKFYTKKEVARILRVTKKTIDNYINSGSLKAKKIGGSKNTKAGKILISKQDLEKFVDSA